MGGRGTITLSPRHSLLCIPPLLPIPSPFSPHPLFIQGRTPSSPWRPGGRAQSHAQRHVLKVGGSPISPSPSLLPIPLPNPHSLPVPHSCGFRGRVHPSTPTPSPPFPSPYPLRVWGQSPIPFPEVWGQSPQPKGVRRYHPQKIVELLYANLCICVHFCR
jgi:hypothetical protein